MISPRCWPASRRRFVSALALALAAVFCPLAAQVALATEPACQEFRVRPQDEIWAVSTRCLGCPSGDEAEPQWHVWKYDSTGPQWLPASSGDFYRSDSPEIVTAMYVHGNQTDSSRALSDGLDVYFQLAGRYDDPQPVRFVIWSWPSDKIHGLMRDVRTKADRADAEAYYLARFLAPISPQVRVGLVGYSFGARIIVGAMHLLGGGELCGLSVAPGERPQFRVALWAAAEHNDWPLPGRNHGQALPMAQWLITVNCCDPVLARYAWIEKCYDPVALGYSGLPGRNLLSPEQNAQIEEIDVAHLVGKTHDQGAYLYSEPIVSRTREVLLWP